MGHDNQRLRTARMIGSHHDSAWDALCAEFDGRCVKCSHRPERLTKDHIVPVVHGGSNAIDNIQPLCDPCNQEKRADDCVDYVSYRRTYGFEVEDHAAAYAAQLTFGNQP